MKNLLFIKHKDFNARTVENDVKILSSEFTIKMYEVNTTKSIMFFVALWLEWFYLLFSIFRYDIIFIWFADYHSLLPVFFAKLFGKKSVINIGGYDADEILIGNPQGLKAKFRKFCVKYSVKNTDLLLPVSDTIRNYLETAVEPAKCHTAYCCIDTSKFQTESEIPVKENVIITVGGGGDFEKEALRKRLDYFIKLGNNFSEKYPELGARFLLIGHDSGSATHKLLSPMIKSANVKLIPHTNVDELISYYQKASIYMQLSYYEAFGIAQIEAMLYGCIPVSNGGGAIADVVGEAGFIVKDYDMNEYMRLIYEVMQGEHEELRSAAKIRVLNNFTLEARANTILPLINRL